MEVLLESLPTGIGLQRPSRLMKEPVHDDAIIIDLDDEIEEEEEWEPEPVSSTLKSGIADEGLSVTSSQEKVLGMQIEVDANKGLGLVGTASNPISSWPTFPKSIAKKVEEISLEGVGAASQRIGLVGSNHDKRDPFASGTDEYAFWQKVIDLDPSNKDTVDCSTIDVGTQQAGFIDLSSSESGYVPFLAHWVVFTEILLDTDVDRIPITNDAHTTGLCCFLHSVISAYNVRLRSDEELMVYYPLTFASAKWMRPIRIITYD